MFLLVPKPHLPCQDYCLKEPQRTLPYAKALQYWAEKAKLGGPNEPWHLAMCVQELRQVMKLYTTFSDCNVFKGLTCKISEAGANETMQPNPTKSAPLDDPATLMTTPSALVDELTILTTTHPKPAEESVTLVTTPAVSVDEPSDSTTLPEATSDAEKTEDPEYPKWIKVHLSHPAASMESLPPTLGDLRKSCHNCSSSWRTTPTHLVEEQWALKGNSSSALPQSSPEPACHREGDPGALLKAVPPGFKEIVKSLTRGRPPEIEIDCPLTVASPGLLMGSAVATLTSTGVCQDQTTGAIYLSMVITFMDLMNLETPYSHWLLGAHPKRTDQCLPGGWPP